MRFEEIAQCEIGVVLKNELSLRKAVLVGVHPAPFERIDVHYLDDDRERMEGCKPELFKRTELTAGTLLREGGTSRRAMLMSDSPGPLIQVRFLDSSDEERRTLSEPVGRRWCAAFEIVPLASGTWLRHLSSGERAVLLETYPESGECVVLLWRTRKIKRMKRTDFAVATPPPPPAGVIARTTPQ